MRQQTVMYQTVMYYGGDAIRWKFNGNLHRYVDLPTRYFFSNGELYTVSYYQHNKLHRTTGPAYIDNKNQIKEYWYQGNEYDSLEQMQMLEACK